MLIMNKTKIKQTIISSHNQLWEGQEYRLPQPVRFQ